MSSCDIESQPMANRGSFLSGKISRKWKIAISAALLVGALVAIGVCATAVGLSLTGTRNGNSGDNDEMITSKQKRSQLDLTKPEHENGLTRTRRFPSGGARPTNLRTLSCYSDETNDTLPAAHIKGRGIEWSVEGGVYAPQWDCHGSPAFVTGGMWFNQQQKSLYVPVCGWYSVSSVIAFQNNGDQVKAYSYTLHIDRNCDGDSFNYNKRNNMVNAPVSRMPQSLTSIHINDIVKICKGGRIYVYIPTSVNDCCPRGYSQMTSISAHLVSESDCEWPLDEHHQPREPYQN